MMVVNYYNLVALSVISIKTIKSQYLFWLLFACSHVMVYIYVMSGGSRHALDMRTSIQDGHCPGLRVKVLFTQIKTDTAPLLCKRWLLKCFKKISFLVTNASRSHNIRMVVRRTNKNFKSTLGVVYNNPRACATILET